MQPAGRGGLCMQFASVFFRDKVNGERALRPYLRWRSALRYPPPPPKIYFHSNNFILQIISRIKENAKHPQRAFCGLHIIFYL